MATGATIQRVRSGGMLALALVAASATAQTLNTRWHCRLDDQLLHCRLEHATASSPTSASPDSRLPPIVRELREQPRAWRGRAVHIPLHTLPFDDSALQPLAQAVLCGANPSCLTEVQRTPAPGTVALLDFVDAQDPLLQAAD